MNSNKTYNSSDYIQPINDFSGRSFDGEQEIVNYLSDSSVRIWFNDQSADFPPHWHLAVEIILPLVNNYTAIVDNCTYDLNVGDILLIPAGTLHELIAPKDGCRLIYLFDLSTIYKLKTFSSIASFLYEPLLITKQSMPIIYDDEYNLLLHMSNIYFSKDDFRELSIFSHLLTFLVNIGKNHLNTVMKSPLSRSFKEQEIVAILTNILEYIDSHYSEDLSLEQIAKTAGYSKYYFNRLFKQYAGTTFYDYLLYKRLHESMVLLSDRSLTITEIALRSGFTSIATFNRIFKKEKNCTPSEYRNIYLACKGYKK